VHAGNTAAAPASDVEAIIQSPTNMAAADGGVISPRAMLANARPSCCVHYVVAMLDQVGYTPGFAVHFLAYNIRLISATANEQNREMCGRSKRVARPA